MYNIKSKMTWPNHGKWNDITFIWYICIQLDFDVKETEERTKRMWKQHEQERYERGLKSKRLLASTKMDFNEIKLGSNERP